MKSISAIGATSSAAVGFAKPAANRYREAAEQLVSQLFYQPVLGTMRDSPFGGKFGNGGRMESAFGEQLDMRIADVAARADRSGLIDQVARKITPRHLSDESREVSAALSPSWNRWLEIRPDSASLES